jgi:hypothetical protein
MMQHGRRASLVVSLLLLACVGTASAECAWVLWIRDGDWFPDRAHSGPDKCYAAVVAEIGLARRQGWGDTVVVHGADYAQYIDGVKKVLVSVKCLPDTIDPRGPKTK